MQHRSILVGLLALLPFLFATPASAGTLLRLHADRIAFYYDRFLIEADGHVRLQTSDGLTIEGDAFSMDLKLNRYLVAGHVHITGPTGVLRAAAISDFLDFDRTYVLPVTSEPDRWTFLGTDYAHPAKGREMPGDVFAFPDTGNARPNATSHSAVIVPKAYARFDYPLLDTFGAKVPLPTYYVGFSASQALAQNSLSGADVDLTWNFAGSANSISSLHLRYDPTNKQYLALEQHFAWPSGYAVASLNPATERAKFWNLITLQNLGSRFQFQSFNQLYTDQSGLSEPKYAAQWGYLSATQAFAHSYAQLLTQLTNYNLIGPSDALGSPNHPTSMLLNVTSFPNRIGHTPIYERLNYSFGFNHDSVGEFPSKYKVPGLQTYGGVTYTTIWNHSVGITLYTSALKFGDRDNPYKTYYFNATYNKQRQWMSVPHHIDTTTAQASVSRTFDNHFNAYVAYSVANTGDYYINGSYVPYEPTINGVLVTSFGSFRGVSTLRTTTLGANFDPDPDFTFALTARKHNDFPLPYPDLFPLPLFNVLGQYISTSFLGQPPYDVTGDLRVRVAPHVVLDLARTYYFNFGNLRWSPSMSIQVSQ